MYIHSLTSLCFQHCNFKSAHNSVKLPLILANDSGVPLRLYHTLFSKSMNLQKPGDMENHITRDKTEEMARFKYQYTWVDIQPSWAQKSTLSLAHSTGLDLALDTPLLCRLSTGTGSVMCCKSLTGLVLCFQTHYYNFINEDNEILRIQAACPRLQNSKKK